MCEYALKEDGKMLMCAYTGKPCTLCVLGSGETFAEAEEKRIEAERKYERRRRNEQY